MHVSQCLLVPWMPVDIRMNFFDFKNISFQIPMGFFGAVLKKISTLIDLSVPCIGDLTRTQGYNGAPVSPLRPGSALRCPLLRPVCNLGARGRRGSPQPRRLANSECPCPHEQRAQKENHVVRLPAQECSTSGNSNQILEMIVRKDFKPHTCAPQTFPGA